MAKRHVRYREEDLEKEHLSRPLTLKELKEQWNDAVARAEELFARLPLEEVGCLYLSTDNIPLTPKPIHLNAPKVVGHFGSVYGAWPKTG